MAEWRLLRTWTRAELSPRIAQASSLAPSAPEGPLTLGEGWNRVISRAVIGVEAAGPPEANGPFERARFLICRLGFSDRRIVVGHWRDNAHLRGRTVLLELKSLGLHFLCPVRVGAVKEETREHRSVFGFRFDTLEGHLEKGREWFLLTKDHATGEISFHIEASWRGGDFPNWWSAAGFHLLGRRYQRAWHRLAHQHLREALRHWGREERGVRGHAAAQPAVSAPVQIFAQKAIPVVTVDKETETMRNGEGLMTAAAFGALAGGRSVLGPALIAMERKRHAGFFGGARARRIGRVSSLLQIFAVGELIADKLPLTPSRTRAISLLARAASGGLTGAAVSPRSRAAGAVLGAAAAVAGSFALHRLRAALTDRLGGRNLLAGALEDAALIGLGIKLAARVA